MCAASLLLTAALVGGTACRSLQRGSDSAGEIDLGPAPAPVIPSGPIPLAPPRLWLFDSETDTAEPAEFTGYGGKWSIDRRNPSPRYYQSLCHEPSPTNVRTPHSADNGRRREGDIAIADGAYFSNVDLSAYVKVGEWGAGMAAGLAFGVRAGDDLYLAGISPADKRAELLRRRPQELETIASGNFELGEPGWHLLRVRAFGNAIELFIDDVSVLRGPVDGISPGMVGLWAGETAAACFDEVAAAPR